MAGAPGTSAPSTQPMSPAASANSTSGAQIPQPSGLMIGPSTTGDYLRPMHPAMLPTGFNQQANQGPCGYGYYNPNTQQYMGTSGIFGYCQGGNHYGMEVGQALHCGTPMPQGYQRPTNGMPVYQGSQAPNQCAYNQQLAQMYQQSLANPNCGAAYRDMVKQQNAGFKGCASQGLTQTPYVQLGSQAYWGGRPGCGGTGQMQPGSQLQGISHGLGVKNPCAPVTHACCNEFTGFATTPVNAQGFDAGGVPLSLAALASYNNAASLAQNSTCNWNNALHSGCPGQVGASAQWLGLEGATRGLCLLSALVNELPGGLCVSYQGSGGSNSPGGNFFSYPWGCTVTYSHEMQEMLNPNCPTGNQDNSDVRYNSPGTPAHCNNFKSCGVGWQCLDTALTAFFGCNYGTAPGAWEFAKSPSYQGGALLGPGGGPTGPGAPGVIQGPNGPIVIIPGGGSSPIAQVNPASGQAAPGGRKKIKPDTVGGATPTTPGGQGQGGAPATKAFGGYVQNFACGGAVYGPSGMMRQYKPQPTNAAPTPAPIVTPGQPPIIITPPPPPCPGPPPAPCIQPFISASPAYPYRGVTCEKNTSFPGFESWNYPLGTPETPGGPGIPTPPCTPACTPNAICNNGGNVIPISNVPGISGIIINPDGTITYVGPDGKPIGGPVGNPTPSPGCTPNPCTPCVPAPTPKPCDPCHPTSPFGPVSPFMPCYMGVSPWPSPQNAFGGCLPQTPWLPGGHVCNGLGPSPAAPASPIYGLGPQNCSTFHGPAITPAKMPFAAPSSTTTTTTQCTNHPSYCQWDHSEDKGMLANNYTQGGNAPWSYLANLQAGNIGFPTVTNTTTNPGLAPVTPGQCGNLYAYPGSDKWTGTSPNPYIYGTPPAPCTPAPCGGDGDDDWDDHGDPDQMMMNHHPGGGHPGPGGGGNPACNINGSTWTGPACFGGTNWGNTGVWGGWGSPQQNEPPEDSAEAWARANWDKLWGADIANHPFNPTTTTTQGAIPCWHPPDWNAPGNPGFTNTSNPGHPGGMPSWPGQVPSTTPAGQVGGYQAQATPFLNGDLYQPGFENVGAGFQGNPWQPQCLSLVNPGAISMGLAGFQVPAPTPPPAPAPGPAPGPGGGDDHHHARGGSVGHNLVDVALSPGEDVIMPHGGRMSVPGQAQYGGDTEKNDTYRTKLPGGAIVLPRTVAGKAEREARFVAAVRANKSPSEALRRAHG